MQLANKNMKRMLNQISNQIRIYQLEHGGGGQAFSHTVVRSANLYSLAQKQSGTINVSIILLVILTFVIYYEIIRQVLAYLILLCSTLLHFVGLSLFTNLRQDLPSAKRL